MLWVQLESMGANPWRPPFGCLSALGSILTLRLTLATVSPTFLPAALRRTVWLTRPFAGGMAFNLPMLGDGTLYAANITSDPDTGIGKWTDQNVIDAITKLTRPDGSHIDGPMVFYLAGWSALTDDDLKALAAYVKTIPAVSHAVPASTFKPHAAPTGKPG